MFDTANRRDFLRRTSLGCLAAAARKHDEHPAVTTSKAEAEDAGQTLSIEVVPGAREHEVISGPPHDVGILALDHRATGLQHRQCTTEIVDYGAAVHSVDDVLLCDVFGRHVSEGLVGRGLPGDHHLDLSRGETLRILEPGEVAPQRLDHFSPVSVNMKMQPVNVE